MTNDTRKPREFWLHPSNNEQGILSWRSVTGPLPVAVDGKYGEALHVIEYSAFEELAKELQDIKTCGSRDALDGRSSPDEVTAQLLQYKQAFRTKRTDFDCLRASYNKCSEERDEYRAALEKIKAINATEANGTDKERASSYWNRLHRIQSFAIKVLAKYPKESG